MPIPTKIPQRHSNRYELPPESQPDDVREAAEIEERVDGRSDLPEMRTEKGESSAVDSAYAGEVSNYFNERRLIADQTDVEDTELFDYDKFVVMQQQSLEKLANPSTAKEMSPQDVAPALGDLAGTMAGRNLEIEANRTGDPRIDRDTESAHARAKKVFMDSCEKVFPHVSVDKKNFGADLKWTMERLGRSTGAELPPELQNADLEKMSQEDPRGLAKVLDGVLYRTGDLLQSRSRISFDLEDRRKREEASGHLAPGTEMFYKLQLMRDALQERMYGRKDVLPSEAREIDGMRRAFDGEKTGGGRTEADAAGAGEEPESLKKLDMAAADEQAEAKEQAADKSPAARTLTAAGEALRGIWKKDQAFAGRLEALSGRIENMTRLKLGSGPVIEPAAAYRLSMRQIFGELLPAENTALKEAARQESDRLRREAEEKKLPPPDRPISAERLFVDMMSALVEKGRS